MLLRNANMQKNLKLTEQMKVAQEREDIANEAVHYDEAAKRYLKQLNDDKFALKAFIKENLTILTTMAGKYGYDVSKALSGKRTYRKYKLWVKLVTSKMMIQEIKIPTLA